MEFLDFLYFLYKKGVVYHCNLQSEVLHWTTMNTELKWILGYLFLIYHIYKSCLLQIYFNIFKEGKLIKGILKWWITLGHDLKKSIWFLFLPISWLNSIPQDLKVQILIGFISSQFTNLQRKRRRQNIA